MGNNMTVTRNGGKIMGNHNKIKGNNCEIMGNNNHVEGDNNKVTGNHNDVWGNHITITGNNCRSWGNDNKMTGKNNVVTGERSTAVEFVDPPIGGWSVITFDDNLQIGEDDWSRKWRPNDIPPLNTNAIVAVEEKLVPTIPSQDDEKHDVELKEGDSDDLACVACMARRKTCMAEPCNHVSYCITCSRIAKMECPNMQNTNKVN